MPATIWHFSSCHVGQSPSQPSSQTAITRSEEDPPNGNVTALLAGKTTHAAWRSKPSFYAVSTEDRTINPDLERFMAKRMGAKTIEVKSSHLSLISHPDEITQLILEAAGQQRS
jgi:pimeloyl-ACP methyl ester carboxylesterase